VFLEATDRNNSQEQRVITARNSEQLQRETAKDGRRMAPPLSVDAGAAAQVSLLEKRTVVARAR
jgi:hypothetical protein